MALVTYNIPDNRIDQIAVDWCYLYPNTERKVKDGVDPRTIPADADISDDKYYQDSWTDKQWFREHNKRRMNNDLKRSRQKQAQDDLTQVIEGEVT